MRVSVRLLVIPVAIVASNCGRLGYDEIMSLGGPSSNATGGTGSGPDSGTAGSAGAVSNGGDASSGGGASGGGGTPGNGGSVGTGGIVGGGGTPGNDGSVGVGGIVGGGGTAGNGGAVGSGGIDGAVGSGGINGGGTAGTGGGAAFGDAGIVGCADGQREGFLDLVAYPAIAACAGGFALPGVVGLTGPACGRAAGDDSANPGGAACNAEDICAAGFHMCSTAAEVASKSSTGCTGASVGATPVFYVTAQSGPGARACGAGIDDLFGCGSLGARPVNGSNCTPLDKWSSDLCGSLTAPWACGTDPTAEAMNVVKPGPTAGGVLCCQD